MFRLHASHDKHKTCKPKIQIILSHKQILCYTLVVNINLAERGNSADTTTGKFRFWLLFPQVSFLANKQFFKCLLYSEYMKRKYTEQRLYRSSLLPKLRKFNTFHNLLVLLHSFPNKWKSFTMLNNSFKC